MGCLLLHKRQRHIRAKSISYGGHDPARPHHIAAVCRPGPLYAGRGSGRWPAPGVAAQPLVLPTEPKPVIYPPAGVMGQCRVLVSNAVPGRGHLRLANVSFNKSLKIT
jgi:hypothetical protein